jgi:hypothetical protein
MIMQLPFLTFYLVYSLLEIDIENCSEFYFLFFLVAGLININARSKWKDILLYY